MAWTYLIIAGIFEIIWAVAIKYCDGFKISIPLFLVALSMVLSLVFLSLALKTLPMSIAYAIWTSIGIVGVFTYGVFILKEPASLNTVFFIGLILIGIIGLKLQSR